MVPLVQSTNTNLLQNSVLILHGVTRRVPVFPIHRAAGWSEEVSVSWLYERSEGFNFTCSLRGRESHRERKKKPISSLCAPQWWIIQIFILHKFYTASDGLLWKLFTVLSLMMHKIRFYEVFMITGKNNFNEYRVPLLESNINVNCWRWNKSNLHSY